MLPGTAKELSQRHQALGFRKPAGPEQIDAEQAQSDRSKRHQSQLHFFIRQALAQQGPRAHTDGKQGQQQGDHTLTAGENSFGEIGELGQIGGPQQPEPGDAEDGQKNGTLASGVADRPKGFTEQIPANDQMGRMGGRDRNHPTGQPAGQGNTHQHQPGDRRAVFQLNQHAAAKGAQQNRDKGAHFDQGVPAHDLCRFQLVRHDTVFNRTEKSGLGAHEEQEPQQDCQAGCPEGHTRTDHDEDLHHLDPADQQRLFHPVGNLSGGGGKEKKRENKQSGGHVDHHVGCHGQPLARLKSDHQHQGIFKHVIVKGAEKLGPEKGCEPSRRKQPEQPSLGFRLRIGI
jgi:hypothetical protein